MLVAPMYLILILVSKLYKSLQYLYSQHRDNLHFQNKIQSKIIVNITHTFSKILSVKVAAMKDLYMR